MKKVLATYLALAIALWLVAPALSVAKDITTTLSRGDAGGSGEYPLVKVKWEMLKTWDGNNADDDPVTKGAQFMPSGLDGVDKEIKICAIVHDGDGMGDIKAVYGDVYYPNFCIGPDHHAYPAPYNKRGCGQLHNECVMTSLDKIGTFPTNGYNLFCNSIKNYNENLVTWKSTYTAKWEGVCHPDTGEFKKQTAYVYCCDKTISYEDPSGNYKTIVVARDQSNLDGSLENSFLYKEMTAFITDFSSIAYGVVKESVKKLVTGDLDLTTPAAPTVKNVGTTRLQMTVLQDDMGLGQTDGIGWNIEYDARVGSDASWKIYSPAAQKAFFPPSPVPAGTPLLGGLNLSEIDEMDFSVHVKKFPPSSGSGFDGKMILGGKSAAHWGCIVDTGECASPPTP